MPIVTVSAPTSPWTSPRPDVPHDAVALPAADLDAILALQLMVAWAGEAQSQPPRLGWWRTDLVDRDGGAGLLFDLLPRTWRWASLQATRKAATRVDQRARQQMARSDRVRTLFHWGFQVDEKLDERLRVHKQALVDPDDVLPFPLRLGDAFDRDGFSAVISAFGDVEARVVPDGRELLEVPDAPVEIARALTAALLPLARTWPAPFYRTAGHPGETA
ncbi:MAG: BREX-6 system BrxE protein [bacterium]|nr:BREX-6 system BrxE protein [bacterium]